MVKAEDRVDDGQGAILSLLQVFKAAEGGPRDYLEWFELLSKPFRGRRPLARVPWLVALCKRRNVQPKQCYYNSQLLSLDDARLRYFEGYCFTGMIPLSHAWLVLPDGTVVDPTLEQADRLLLALASSSKKARARAKDYHTRNATYLGVEVDRDFVQQLVCARDWCGPLLGAWYEALTGADGQPAASTIVGG
jgi:hypothetical protein